MSQFLLLRAEHPSTHVPGISFALACNDVSTAKAANHVFGPGIPVWVVTDATGGADTLADSARDAVVAGFPVQTSPLGRFLAEQVGRNVSFCLYWASDFHDLPQPTSVENLFSLLAEQLRSVGNWELYALWLVARGA